MSGFGIVCRTACILLLATAIGLLLQESTAIAAWTALGAAIVGLAGLLQDSENLP